jgi:dihydrofolate synthase/folylpolyglutamate synthase
MDYQQALVYLESPARFSPRLGLDRMQQLLDTLDRPERAFPSVLIGGTSGKGSSAKLIQAVLSRAGFRTGFLSKPHLQDYRERVTVDGCWIDKSDLTRIVSEMVPAAREIAQGSLGHPTFFEMGAALAFRYFAERRVDVAVVEVGLGGRLDATNVLQPILCGITPVGFDHTEILGETLAQIATEKAGILKPGVPAVLAPQPEEALAVIRQTADRIGLPLYSSEIWSPALDAADWSGQTFSLRKVPPPPGMLDLPLEEGFAYRRLELPLAGAHQVGNAAFALTVLWLLQDRGFAWEEKQLREAWRDLFWPGRMEILSRRPLLLIDGAHNPEKARALAEAVRALGQDRRCVLVLGVSREKDLGGVLQSFLPLAPTLIATQAQSERARPAEEILAMGLSLGLTGEQTLPLSAAAERAQALAGAEGLVLVTGSMYVAGEARDLFFPVTN